MPIISLSPNNVNPAHPPDENNIMSFIDHILSVFHSMLDQTFELSARKVTVKSECYAGLIHFFSCLYAIPVVGEQMHLVGYDIYPTIAIISLVCGIGSIVSGILSNLPLIIAPPVSLVIFFIIYLMRHDIDDKNGSRAVF